jgi:hypothetical protein
MSGPHDRFVRYTLGHPERAAAELRAALPAELVAQVDWSTLRREPSNVVDAQLRETQSDLLFSAQLTGGQPVLIFVLIEHQSTVDRWMALRMLKYVVRQWEAWHQQHPERPLPVIVPLVLYHGPEGRWTAPLRVEELVEMPEGQEARGGVPHFGYHLDDLTAARAKVLLSRTGPALVKLLWVGLRYGNTPELARQLKGLAMLFAQVQADPGGAEELRMVVQYLLWVGDRAVRKVLEDVLDSVVGQQHTEELMQTVGQKLFAQGEAKGEAKGQAKYVLRTLVRRGIPVDAKTRRRIMSCKDTRLLDQWFDRAWTASSVAEVLGEASE